MMGRIWKEFWTPHPWRGLLLNGGYGTFSEWQLRLLIFCHKLCDNPDNTWLQAVKNDVRWWHEERSLPDGIETFLENGELQWFQQHAQFVPAWLVAWQPRTRGCRGGLPTPPVPAVAVHACPACGKVCRSAAGLAAHLRCVHKVRSWSLRFLSFLDL